jgi:hypothetical protein
MSSIAVTSGGRLLRRSLSRRPSNARDRDVLATERGPSVLAWAGLHARLCVGVSTAAQTSQRRVVSPCAFPTAGAVRPLPLELVAG